MTVAKDGSGDYTTIQEAIDAAKAFPDHPIKIYIKPGVYEEKVVVYSWNTNLSLIGDTTEQVIISYHDYFDKMNKGRNSTFHTYTLKVTANDFYASNLTVANTAGDVGQAVALHVEADRAVFVNCTFKGHQDTMYLAGEGARQYFEQCTIQGTTDFIFGGATAFFQSCDIISLKSSYITAAATPEGQRYGFVFRDCKLFGDGLPKGQTYLGRPWRNHAQTVFIGCEMAGFIHPEGWKAWNSDGSCFFAEYGSMGAGANPDQRVSWSHQLSEKEAKQYTQPNIFNDWIPTAHL